MPKFKDLSLTQKQKLLRDEYLKDGAEEKFIDELIPDKTYQNPYAAVNARLKDVFGWKDEMEVEI